MEITLGKKALLYRRLTAAVVFAAVFSAAILILGRYFLLSVCLCTALAVIFFVLCFFYLPLSVRSTAVRVQNGYIYCKKGVFITREYYYPNLSVQYVTRLSLPLGSCLGLTVPIIRGTGHNLILPEMDFKQWQCFLMAVSENGQ